MKIDLNRSIERRFQAFQKAQQALIDEILKQQRACKHEVVWELPWQSLEYAGGLNPRRMCVACRYEEEGTPTSGGSSWARKHKDGQYHFRSVLKAVFFATPIGRDEFYAKRMHPVPDYVQIDFAEEARREAAKFPFMACPNKSRPLDPLEGCGNCGGCGYHRSIPNPHFAPATEVAIVQQTA